MCVVRNRRPRFARWRASSMSYKAICLAPRQFSCWNANSGSNHNALVAIAEKLVTWDGAIPLPDQLRECIYLAQGVIGGAVIDRTGAANSYYAPAAMQPPGRVPEGAVNRPTILIGDQVFYSAV